MTCFNDKYKYNIRLHTHILYTQI